MLMILTHFFPSGYLIVDLFLEVWTCNKSYFKHPKYHFLRKKGDLSVSKVHIWKFFDHDWLQSSKVDGFLYFLSPK